MSRLFALLVLVACIADASAQYYGGYGYGAYVPAYTSGIGYGYSGLGYGYGGLGYGYAGGLAYYKK